MHTSEKMAQTSIEHTQVVIVGLGASALGTAKVLLDNGVSVTILEARHRHGGRINCVFMTPNLVENIVAEPLIHPTVHVELGANWLHNLKHNAWKKVAIEMGLTLQKSTDDDLLMCDLTQPDFENKEDVTRDPIFSAAELKQIDRRYAWIIDTQFERSIKQLTHEASDPSMVSLQAVFDDALKKCMEKLPCADPRIWNAVKWNIYSNGLECAAPLKEMSATAWWTDSDDENDGGDALVVGGISLIFNHILDQLLLNPLLKIRYHHTVLHIDQSDSVRITSACVPNDDACRCSAGCGNCSTSSDPGTVVVAELNVTECDTCVVTVPLGVLRSNSIRFTPPLSEDKQAAIQHVDMGLLNIVVMWYPSKFWPDGVEYLGCAGANFCDFMIPTAVDSTGQPAAILVAFVGGPFAVDLEKRTRQDIAEEVTATLRRMFAQTMQVPDPLGCVFSRWNSDPCAHGSYTAMPPGSCTAERQALAAAEQRVHFAGEHTCGPNQFFATVHGAYESGRRAAKQVLKQLRK